MSHDSISTYKVTPYQRDPHANSGGLNPRPWGWVNSILAEPTWLGMLLLVLIAKIVIQNMISYNGII